MQLMLGEILDHGDSIVRGWDRFKAFLHRVNFTQPLSELNETDISSLSTGLNSNSTCGHELKRLTDRTWMTVAQMKRENPGITAAAYQTRDTLRKTLGEIVDDLINKGKSDNGTSLSAKEYTRVVADKLAMTIFVISIFDDTGVMGIVTEYIQPVCGPTQFIGEVDDGDEPYTLGLSLVGKAFQGSSLSWERKGDGVVTITFKSEDTKPVAENIFSGGKKTDEKDVPAGGNARTSNVTMLGGKTLYLDRWRPGILGLPGTGGGSLKLWIPRASEGGHLDLSVAINVS
ncbi:hypothetical protein GN244_ATG06013 [Phytophthora infestans]|uniref:Jacalin-type lectin domain-containing protein n=1 Tax=Phytophthora infestans TaxID=4787 RepID=A0A833TJ17_PHYIN|nr:hypothetical protein GN244_ATG06013 [Phytophthora infestans]